MSLRLSEMFQSKPCGIFLSAERSCENCENSRFLFFFPLGTLAVWAEQEQSIAEWTFYNIFAIPRTQLIITGKNLENSAERRTTNSLLSTFPINTISRNLQSSTTGLCCSFVHWNVLNPFWWHSVVQDSRDFNISFNIPDYHDMRVVIAYIGL